MKDRIKTMKEELKTLKELEGDIGNAEYFHREDIEPTKDYDKVVLVDELKAEAVKWIKEIDSNSYGAREILIKFFNLTKKDLKGSKKRNEN